jgi:peptidoglycan/LPS O-acetylase OafA/YrhL
MVGYGGRMRRSVVLATLLDACCVIAFVTLGRHAHHEGDSAAGIWYTAWPFLGGLAIGLTAVRYWRRPAAIRPAGLGAWLGAALVGMAIRAAAGQGTAVAFMVVALGFLGLFLLGWRCTTLVFSRLSHTSP